MPEEINNEEDQLNDQRAENEIKKFKLSLEHGMDFSKSYTDSDLPPEVEGEFLDYMQQWEDQFAQRKMTTVYELAGRPEYKPVAEIPDDEISGELDRLMEALQQKSVSVDTLCEVDERVLYRFITEELFKEQTQDIQIPGMMHCFTYEEFHPNHPYDIKRRCEEFVEYIFDKREDAMESWCLADTVQCGEHIYEKKEFVAHLKHFRESFSAFTQEQFEFISCELNDAQDDGVAKYRIHYTGNIEGSNDVVEFEGECSLWVKRDVEWWMVYRFEMPGVVV